MRLALLLAALVLLPQAALAQGRWLDTFAYPGTRTTDSDQSGDVYALAADGLGGYYMGGAFERVDSRPARLVAHWTGGNWEALGRGLEVESFGYGVVYALAQFADGGVYAGGAFNFAIQATGARVSANGIARWDAGQWSALGGGLQTETGSGTVLTVAENPSGGVLVGGRFTSAVQPDGASAPVSGIALWTGTVWQPFDVGGVEWYVVSQIAVGPGGRIAVAGTYSGSNGLPVDGVFVRDGAAWSRVFDVSLFSQPKLVWDGATLYISGSLPGPRIHPNVGSSLARWVGGTWTVVAGVDGSIGGLGIDPEGRVVVGGRFSRTYLPGAAPGTAGGIARWSPSGWEEKGFLFPVFEGSTEPLGQVRALLIDGARVVAGGEFSAIRSPSGATSLAYNVAEASDAVWRPLSSYRSAAAVGGIDRITFGAVAVTALAPSGCGPGVIVGGSFGAVGGRIARGVAHWTGDAWEVFGGGLEGSIAGIASAGCSDNRPSFYVSQGGQAPISQWDGSAWRTIPPPPGGASVLEYAGSTLYATGITSTPAPRFAAFRLQPDGTWAPLGGGFDGPVRALAVGPDGDLYAAGAFTSVQQPDGTTLNASGLAQWTGTAWAWPGGPVRTFSDGVQDIAFGTEGELYVAGSFSQIAQPNGPTISVRNVARLDAAGWSDAGDGSLSPVHALTVLDDGTLAAAMNTFDPARGALAINDGTGWVDVPDVRARVNAVTGVGEMLFVGGGFYSVAGVPTARLASYISRPVAAETLPTEAPRNGLSAFPNPARSATTLRFAADGPARLVVLDLLGRTVAVVLDGERASGEQTVRFDTSRLPAGVYVARLDAGGVTQTARITVVR